MASLWRDHDFNKLFLAQTISLFGSSLTRMGLPLIAAVTLNATPAEMGILAIAQTVPVLLIGLAAGVWIDRHRPRRFLIASDIGRGLLLLTVPAAAMTGVLSIYQLYAVAFSAGVLGVLFNVAHTSYLPALVQRERLVEANGKLGLGASLNSVAGPSLAGLVVQAITAPMAIAADAISFLISALLILLIRCLEPNSPAHAAPRMLNQVREGLGTVLGNRVLRAFASCMATSNLTSNIFFSLYMLFGTRDLNLDAAQLGIVYGLGATGALFGALLAPRVANRLGLGPAITAGAFIGSIEIVPAVLATPDSAVPLLILSSFLGNMGWVLYSVNSASVRQAVVPLSLQGRMNATFLFITAGALPLGGLAGGALGQLLGVRQAIVISALGSLLAFLWILFSPVRSLRQIPEPAIE